MYELGSSLPAAGDRTKKKFGEKNLSEVGAILKAKRFLYQRGFNELQIQSVLGDA